MEQIEQGSRKYGHSNFLKNHSCPNETIPKKQFKARCKHYPLSNFCLPFQTNWRCLFLNCLYSTYICAVM